MADAHTVHGSSLAAQIFGFQQIRGSQWANPGAHGGAAAPAGVREQAARHRCISRARICGSSRAVGEIRSKRAPGPERNHPGGGGGSLQRLVDNQLMVWSVVLGALLPIPFVYIPTVNTRIFKQAPITRKCAIVVSSVLAFFVLSESYKLLKRKLMKTPYVL
ncbi:hypothetical protein AXG93_3884s1200 [Marchantia polymorpha subsp. ruderalis]|uniref:Cation-transporting P-type ATPase C-terminal domain-containing protein n=1 Tax=Marchantia polymorpha subsp. ruderalis TaxID=1480154 RepID=A0A176W9M0_MARPO|nr:hypothetical protein AXG93_3884s1200 [Marchantia polymorpha subsp. ruderalis]